MQQQTQAAPRQTEPYMVLRGEGGTSSTVIHRPTGKTVAYFDSDEQPDHYTQAVELAAQRNQDARNTP